MQAFGGRQKKLIIAGTLYFSEVIGKTYICELCKYRDRKKLGCKTEKKRPFDWVDCICEGNKKCTICKGGNMVLLRRCPRAIAEKTWVARVAPYFFHWHKTEFMQWPDGRGIMYQPIVLRMAFDILLAVYNQEMEKIKKIRDRD